MVGITREDYFSGGKAVEWLVHICDSLAWKEASEAGEYRPAAFDREGFIHCSRPSQAVGVANAFYRGQTGLALLWIDPMLAVDEVRWEAADEQVFPHLYGPLNPEAVVDVTPFEPDEDGVFRLLPDPIRPFSPL